MKTTKKETAEKRAALAHLDSAIEIIMNALTLLKAGLDPEKGGE